MPEAGIVEVYRDTHHRIAQMFAMGMTPSMIRQQTGISQRRLLLYWNSPSFQELIKKYSAETEEKLRLAADVVSDLGVSSTMMLASMLNDRIGEAFAGEAEMPVGQMLKLFEVHADRFGYGKHSTVKHEHDFAAALDKAIDRSSKAGAVIDVKAEDASCEPLPLPGPAESILPDKSQPAQPKPAKPAPSFSGTFRRIRVSNVA